MQLKHSRPILSDKQNLTERVTRYLACSSSFSVEKVYPEIHSVSVSVSFSLLGHSSLGFLFFNERQSKCLTPVGQYR